MHRVWCRCCNKCLCVGTQTKKCIFKRDIVWITLIRVWNMRLLIIVVYCLIVIHGSSSVPGLSKKQKESFSSAQALGQGIPVKNEDVEDAYGQMADKGNQLSLLTNVKSHNIIHNSAIGPLQKDTGIGNYHSNVLKNRLKTNEKSNENTDYSIRRETNHNGVIDDSLNNGPGTKDVVHSRSKREIKKAKKTAMTYRYESEPIKSRFSYVQKIQKLNEQKETAEHKILNEHHKVVIENHSALEEHNSEETHEHHSRTTSQFKVTKKKRKVKRKRGPQGTMDDSEEYEDDDSTEEESAETDGSSTKNGSSTATEAESSTKNNSFQSKTAVQPHVSTVAIRNSTKKTVEETENKAKRNKIALENKQVSGQTVAMLRKKEKSLEEVNESKYLFLDEKGKAKTERAESRQQSTNQDLLFGGKGSQSSSEARKTTDVLKSNTQSENLYSKNNKQISRQNVLSAVRNVPTLKNNLGNKYTNINPNYDYGERIVKAPNASQRLIPSKKQVTEPKNPARDRWTYNKPASSSMGLFYDRRLKATVNPLSAPNMQNVPMVQKSITATRNQAAEEASESAAMRQSKRVGFNTFGSKEAVSKSSRIVNNRQQVDSSQSPVIPGNRHSVQNSPIGPTFQTSNLRAPGFAKTSKKALYDTSITDFEEENTEMNKNVESDKKMSFVKVPTAVEQSKVIPSSKEEPNQYENIASVQKLREKYPMPPNIPSSQTTKTRAPKLRRPSKADMISKEVLHDRYITESEEQDTETNKHAKVENRIDVFNPPRVQASFVPKDTEKISTGPESIIIRGSPMVTSTGRAAIGSGDINTETTNSIEMYNKNKKNAEINRNVETYDKYTIIKGSKERENLYSVDVAPDKSANVLKSMRPSQIRPAVVPLRRAVKREPKVEEENPDIYQSPQVNAEQPDLRRNWLPSWIRIPTFKIFQNKDTSASEFDNANSKLSKVIYNAGHKETTPRSGDDRYMWPKRATIPSWRELHDTRFNDLQKDMSEINRNYKISNRESIFKLPKVLRNPFYVPFGSKKSKNVPSSPSTSGLENLPAGPRSPSPTVNRPIVSSDSIETREPRLERPTNKEKSKDSNKNTKEKINDDIDNNKTLLLTSPFTKLPKLSQYISDFQRSINNFNNRLQQSLAQKISKINSVSTSLDNVNDNKAEGIDSQVNIFGNKNLNQPKTVGNLPFASNLFAEKNNQEIKENMDSLLEKYGWRNSRKAVNEEGNQSTSRKVPPLINNLPYATRSPFINWPVFAPVHTPSREQKIGESKAKAVSTLMLESNDREEYFRKGESKNSEENINKNLQANQAPLNPFNRVNTPSRPNERYGLNSEENSQSPQKDSIKGTTSQQSHLSTDLIKYSKELNDKLDAFLNQHQQALNNIRSVLKLPAVSDKLPEVTRLPAQIPTIRNQNLTRLKTNGATAAMVKSKNTEEEYTRRATDIRFQNSFNYLPTVPDFPKIAGNLPAITISQSRFKDDPSNGRSRPLITEDLKPQKPKSQTAPTIYSKRYNSKTNILDSSIPQVPAVTDYRPEYTRPFSNGYNPRFNTEAVPRMPNPARNLPLYQSETKEPETILATPKIPTTQGNRLFDFPLQNSPARLPNHSNPNRELGSSSGEKFSQKQVHDRTPTLLNQYKLAGNVQSVQNVPAVADYRPEVTRRPMKFDKLPTLQPSPPRTSQLGFDRPENKFSPLNTENSPKNNNSNKNRYGTEDYDTTEVYFNRPQVERNFPYGGKVPKVNLPDVTGSPMTFKNGPIFFPPEKSAVGVPEINSVPSSQNFAYNTPESFRVPNISQSEQASFPSKSHEMAGNRPVFNPPQPLPRVPKVQLPSVPNIYHRLPNMERQVPGVEDDTGPSSNIPNFGRNLAPVSKVPKLGTPTPTEHWPILDSPQSSAMLPEFRRPTAKVVTPPAEAYYPHPLIPTEHGSENFLNVPEKTRGFLPRPNLPNVKGNLRNIPNSPFTLYNQPHAALFPSRLPKVPKLHRIENGIIPMPYMFPYNTNMAPHVPTIIGRVQPFHTVPSFYYPHSPNVPVIIGRVKPVPKLPLIRSHQKIPMKNKPHLMVGSPFPRNIYPVPKIAVVGKPQDIPLLPTMNGSSENRNFHSPKKHTEDEQETLDIVALGERAGQTILGIPVSNAAGKIEYLTVGNREGDMNLIRSKDTTGKTRYLYRIRDETGRYHNLYLKPTRGHLSLVESDYFGGRHSTGFIGYDGTGEYVVPVHFEGNHHLVIYPYARSLRYAVHVHPANEIINEFFKYKN